MEKLSLYDLCIIANSLSVELSKLSFEEDGHLYVPTSSGKTLCDNSDILSSDLEYCKLRVLIRVLYNIYNFRPL